MRKSFKTGIVAAFAALALSVFGFAGVALAANGTAIDGVIDSGITAVNNALKSGGNYAQLSARNGNTITCTITDGGVNVAHVQDDIVSVLVQQVAAQKNNVVSITALKGINGKPSGKTTLQVKDATVGDAEITQFAKACVADSSVGGTFLIKDLDGKSFTVGVNGVTDAYTGSYTMEFKVASTKPVQPVPSEQVTTEVTKAETTETINNQIAAKNPGLAEVKAPTKVTTDGIDTLTWNVDVKDPDATIQKLSDNVVSNIMVAAKNAKAASAKSLDGDNIEIKDLANANDNDIAAFSKKAMKAAIDKNASLAAANDVDGVKCNIQIAGKNGAESNDYTNYVIVFNDASGTVTVYRIRDPRTNEHIYTVDEHEYRTQINNGYEDEGARFTVKADAQHAAASDVIVHRLFSTGDWSHLYSNAQSEVNRLVNVKKTHTDDTAAGWVDGGNVVVTRLFDTANGQHLLTTDPEEIAACLAGTWVKDDITLHVLSDNPQP